MEYLGVTGDGHVNALSPLNRPDRPAAAASLKPKTGSGPFDRGFALFLLTGIAHAMYKLSVYLGLER